MESDERDGLERAVSLELKALRKTRTWDIVERPEGLKRLPDKLVFNRKRSADGKAIRHKLRLVIRGISDTENGEETFAPVVYFTIVILILALAVQLGLHVHQTDYGSTFLQGPVRRVVYMVTSKFMNTAPGHVLKLKKRCMDWKSCPVYDLSSSNKK